MRLLTPKRLKENEAFMWRLADRQIDEFLGRGSCELIGDFAGPFTLLVIAELLGVPEADHERFRAQMQGPGRTGTVGGTKENLAHRPLGYLYDTFAAYIEERRRQPGDDVLTRLATVTFPDGSMPAVEDVVRLAANLFAAGQETTVRLLGAAFQLIGEEPELQEMLRAERARIPDFIEETLRIESPVKGDFRLARVATTVGGVAVPAGTTVMVLNGAANRDPRRFDAPGEFRPTRPNAREHLSFGRGIHSCPGAPLARAEAAIAVERLLDRTTDITIDEEKHGPPGDRHYQYAPTYILRGLRRLHLRFTPVA
jgi:cytochrome P450